MDRSTHTYRFSQKCFYPTKERPNPTQTVFLTLWLTPAWFTAHLPKLNFVWRPQHPKFRNKLRFLPTLHTYLVPHITHKRKILMKVMRVAARKETLSDKWKHKPALLKLQIEPGAGRTPDFNQFTLWRTPRLPKLNIFGDPRPKNQRFFPHIAIKMCTYLVQKLQATTAIANRLQIAMAGHDCPQSLSSRLFRFLTASSNLKKGPQWSFLFFSLQVPRFNLHFTPDLRNRWNPESRRDARRSIYVLERTVVSDPMSVSFQVELKVIEVKLMCIPYSPPLSLFQDSLRKEAGISL